MAIPSLDPQIVALIEVPEVAADEIVRAAASVFPPAAQVAAGDIEFRTAGGMTVLTASYARRHWNLANVRAGEALDATTARQIREAIEDARADAAVKTRWCAATSRLPRLHPTVVAMG